MTKCNDTEKAYIEKYRGKLNEAVDNITSVKRNGAWSVSCIQHGFLGSDKCVNNQKYRIPSDIGIGITEALTKFMKGE